MRFSHCEEKGLRVKQKWQNGDCGFESTSPRHTAFVCECEYSGAIDAFGMSPIVREHRECMIAIGTGAQHRNAGN